MWGGGRFVWVFKKTSWNYDHPSEQLQEYIQTYLHQLHFHTFQPTSQPSWHSFIQSCIQASPSSSPSSSASSPPTETASTASSSASRIFVVASYMCTYLAGATSGGILQLYTTLLTFREDCCCFLILHQQLDHHRTPTLPHTHTMSSLSGASS